MFRSFPNSIARILGFAVVLVVGSDNYAQTCHVTETTRVDAPAPAGFDNQFGASVSIDGEWAIVGAPHNDQLATDAGAAYILHRDAGVWSVVQTLVSPPGTTTPAGDRFGKSVAIQGSTIAIGSIGEFVAPGTPPINGGAVHIYTLVGGAWQHTQRLTASDAANGDQLGASVALDGDVLATGALGEDDAGSNSGSVYVFRFNGSMWVQEQKIPSPNNYTFAEFGQSVGVSVDALVIGAPGHAQNGSDAGAAYVYRNDGGVWSLEATLLAPDGAELDLFGTSVAISGQRIVAGSPQHNLPLIGAGAAYAYAFDGSAWIWSQKIQPASLDHTDSFGIAVSMFDDLLVIGSNTKELVYGPSQIPTVGTIATFAGAGYLFRLEVAIWTEDFEMRQEYFHTHFDQTPSNAYDFLGSSAALDGETVLLGASMPLVGGKNDQAGAALLFNVTQPDCDFDGVPDVCESDCNNNLSADVCELLIGAVDDCNLNGVPDECDNEVDYFHDDGVCACGVWGASPCPSDGIDLIWLNRFNVVAGGQYVTHVSIAWTGYTPEGTPGTILIYDDPNNDGDPSDAVLLTTAPTVGHNAFGIQAALTYSTVPVPPTHVGEIGDGFFVGMFMPLQCDEWAAVFEPTPIAPTQSWRVREPLGTANINSPASNPTITVMNGAWALRALALDCNGNGVWDQCDIDGGFSLDLNKNGIPDECDLPCDADIAPQPAGDGTVNINDILFVILHWSNGAGDPADVNGDGVVNVVDLLACIATWGACP